MDISWKFHLPEPMANIAQVSLCENISYWPEKQKYWFRGYQTVKAQKVIIWGRKVSMTLNIAPFPSTIEKKPIAPIPPPPPKRSQLSVERQTRLDELQAKLTAIQATIPPPLADESVYWNYIDPEIFVTTFQQMILAWNNPQMDLKEKFPVVTPFLLRIYSIVKDLQLPDELMRDDTKFCTGLARILQYVQIIEENATIHHYSLPPEVHELELFLDRFTDSMIEGGHKIFGTPPVVDENECKKYVNKIATALYISGLTTDERLVMIEELLEDSCADADYQVELLEGAIKLIWKEVEKKPKKPACPHQELIDRHLAEIGKYMKELEETGEKVWQLRVAEEMVDAANSWRESGEMPLLTKEEFASLIYLTDLHIESTQMDDGIISYKMELYLEDKDDSFTGHFMYVKVENKEVKEITLMG